MADSLHTLLMDQLTELHDSVVIHLNEHSAREVLGEDLDQLRSSGTGKSLVMLALIDDLLRMTEIVLAGRWHPLERKFAEFASGFFQFAASTFTKKGLKQYARFQALTVESAGAFLEFHADSGRPFGGHHVPTQWSGLNICTNVASRFGNLATLDGYEHLTRSLFAALVQNVPQVRREDVQQLVDFIADRCGDVRDKFQPQNAGSQDFEAFAKEREELEALRAELTAQRAQVAEREQLIQQEWRRFQQDRAEFEQLRQQWEERISEQHEFSEERERLANERETLAIERAALNSQRQQLDAAMSEWERSRKGPTISPILAQRLEEEQARLKSERRKLEEERSALWQEREELAALREELLAEQNSPPEEDHVLLAGDSFKQKAGENAAVITSDDANDLLIWAAKTGDLAQLQVALKWGADVDHIAAEEGWKTPLHLAAGEGHLEILKALLKAGADAERTDAESLNPLELAIINEQPESARYLAASVPEAITEAYPVLLRIVRDTKSPLLSRQLCVEAIGNLRGRASDSIPTLLNLLESESRELGLSAAEALAKIDSAILTTQAVPYLSYILDGPLVNSDATNPQWIANLYAARGDLYRLASHLPLAQRDYEAALTYASAEQRPRLHQFLDQLELRISEPHSRGPNAQKISLPRNT